MTKQSRRRQARCHRQDSERSNKKQGAVLDPRTRELIALASRIQKIAVRNQYEEMADPYTQNYRSVMNYLFGGQWEGGIAKKDISRTFRVKGLRKKMAG